MKTDKGTHITIDRERYKQLQEENKKLKEANDFLEDENSTLKEAHRVAENSSREFQEKFEASVRLWYKLKQEKQEWEAECQMLIDAKQELLQMLIRFNDADYLRMIDWEELEELIKKHSNEA